MASLQKISKNTVLLFIGNPKSSGENDIMGKKQKSCKVGQRKYKETKERDARRERKREQKEHEKRCWSYLQCNFSSRLPRDVTDNARINSSNSIDPSWKAIQEKKTKENRMIQQNWGLRCVWWGLYCNLDGIWTNSYQIKSYSFICEIETIHTTKVIFNFILSILSALSNFHPFMLLL